ncbi:tripartite tricarboxylate transporter substrate binding protein [Cupriavidus sp. 8B]
MKAMFSSVGAALLATVLGKIVAPQPATAAEQYPTRPVRIVVPFPAGGGTDTIARVLAKSFTSDTGQAFVVENRAGASGNIGFDTIAKSTADGYTIGLINNNLTMNGAVYKRLPFDPQRDIQPVSLLATSPLVIGVSTSLGVLTLPALRAKAEAQGQPLAFSSCGNGSPEHFSGMMLAAAWNVQFVHVPYKGCAPALADALGGQVQVFVSTVTNTLPFKRDSRIRLLAVTARERSKSMPDVASAAEQGLSTLDIKVWFGLVVPRGLPDPISNKLVALTTAALRKPDVREALASQGYEIVGSSPSVFAETIADEIPMWKKLAVRYAVSLE